MFRRWVDRHERAFLTLFFVAVVGGLAGMAVEAAGDGYGAEVAVAWGAAFAVTALVMAARHRKGRLILRRPEDRERQRATNEASMRWTPLLLGVVIGATVVGGAAQPIAFSALGGVLTAIAPVMLWIAFVLRPDQRPGEVL